MIIEKKDDMLKDMDDEKKFILTVRDEGYQVSKMIELLVTAYNEQLNALTRLRIDMELLDYMILAEPQNNQHAQNRTKTLTALRGKRKIISTIREQILRHVDYNKQGKKNGKKN